MLPCWRQQIREARRALDQGKLEKACEMLGQDDLREFRQAQVLSTEVANQVARRARGSWEAGQSMAAWRDLALAKKMDSNLPEVSHLQQEFSERLLRQAEEYLATGRTEAAKQNLRKLALRKLGGARRRELEEIAVALHQAETLLARGKAAEAIQALPICDTTFDSTTFDNSTTAAAKPRRALATRIEQLRQGCEEHRTLSQQLLEAMVAKQWSAVLLAAGEILALAPHDRNAQLARRKSWRAVGLDATVACRPSTGLLPKAIERVPLALPSVGKKADIGKRAGVGHDRVATESTNSSITPHETMPGFTSPHRFMIWVDSVGGYLVCTDAEVVLGQPVPGGPSIAVPIRADLSARHALLRRDGTTYTLEPLGEVAVDGRKLTGPMLLGNEHEIQLGQSVRLQFSKPHALSATARLTPLSHHRTEPRADSVLLMADSCVLGPKSHCHIVCRGWASDLILFRQEEQIFCRATEPVEVDGEEVSGPTPVDLGARIEGEGFAMSLEGA